MAWYDDVLTVCQCNMGNGFPRAPPGRAHPATCKVPYENRVWSYQPCERCLRQTVLVISKVFLSSMTFRTSMGRGRYMYM